jgi:chromate transporter
MSPAREPDPSAIDGATKSLEQIEAAQPCSIKDFLLYFLRLGTFGFGGPIALAGHMQRDLVERRRWVSKQDYLEGLALSQLSPGPLAAQLAMYLGWIRAGRFGATLVAAAFVLPSFLMVLAISVVYVHFHGLPWIQNLFYGIGAAVIAIIARSAVKLGRMTIGKDPLLIAILAASALLTAWTEKEILWVFLGFGALALFVKTGFGGRRSSAALSLAPLLLLLTTGLSGPAPGELWRISWYFTEAGAFVFGSGLAIVPFLHGGVVDQFHWLNEHQFLDAVAVAMITPGPVVITVAFIGFLVAGPIGAVLAAAGVFLPPYAVVILLAPSVRRWSRDVRVKAFVAGVTAAAAGAIAGAAFVLARRSIIDFSTALIAAITFAVLTKFKRAPEPALILAAGAVGLLAKAL